jgi:A/G-specific adenine glycosylase
VDPTYSPIAGALIDWHHLHGRHDLPWQLERTPYRVWVSEIMLQQTQVAAVIPYYERFIARFPDERALAAGSIDEVLHLWSGLGYYARARNLHRAAIRICEQHGGRFPLDFESVASLPGIGRSTAGAILALSCGERWPILDGNVRRVLSRYFAVEGDPCARATVELLWSHAARCTPTVQVDVYTQAIMDLGATLCTRAGPRCSECPLSAQCDARRSGTQHRIPPPRRRALKRRRHTFMLLAMHSDNVLLVQRSPHGIWGGLWCLPEFASPEAARAFLAEHAAGPGAQAPQPLASIDHSFTHFDLTITPLLARCDASTGVADARPTLWYDPRNPPAVGLPAPIKVLLENLTCPE